MRFSSASLFAIACIAPTVLSEILITAPIGTTTCQGGQQCTVSWSAGSNPPTLAQCGNCDFAVFVGNSQQQTFLQLVEAAVPVATTGGIVFTVDRTIGPNFSGYFIRVQCPIADPTNPAIPLLAFSHMFSLSGMAGTFNATVQAQISGSASAAAGASATPSQTTASTSSSKSTTGTATKSSTTSAKPTTTSNSAAANRVGAGFVLALAASALAWF